jgi:serine kinase of HPr protein (carbohydrate metabolism regulator)
MIRHASLIARRTKGTWRGILIEGPSGAGKSDLVLRALQSGFRLVADDRVCVFASHGRLFGRSPPSLTGLVEARGVGVVRWAETPFAQVDVLARCVETPDRVERMPDSETLLGLAIPCFDLWPFGLSAPMKLLMALENLGGGAGAEYQIPFAPPGGRVGG